MNLPSLLFRHSGFWLLVLATWSLLSCSDHPAASEIEAKVAGHWCAKGLSLHIADGHYRAERANVSIPPEVCQGRYQLRFAEGRWEIHYLPDTLPDYTIAVQCEKIFTLWTRKEGFLIEKGQPHMRDVFTNTPLKACK